VSKDEVVGRAHPTSPWWHGVDEYVRYNPVVAYIAYIEEDDASDELRRLYDRYRDPKGHVDNVLRVHGHNPASMQKHFELYATLMRGPSELLKVQREMIAVVVSAINECHY
jgi:alkylhydroperoxidase family enzyme